MYLVDFGGVQAAAMQNEYASTIIGSHQTYPQAVRSLTATNDCKHALAAAVCKRCIYTSMQALPDAGCEPCLHILWSTARLLPMCVSVA